MMILGARHKRAVRGEHVAVVLITPNKTHFNYLLKNNLRLPQKPRTVFVGATIY